MRHPFRLAAIAGSAALLAGLCGPAMAKPADPSNWHVGVYAPSGRALSEAQASSSPDGLATFHFTTSADTALLTTSQGSQKGNLLGDISGKTLEATGTITGTGPFTYYGQPDECGTPASARLFFQTSNAGGFDETHYWWSNPSSQPLADGALHVSATVDGSQWTDYYGHRGDDPDYSAGFAKAAANATSVGLSFGGGCFFENGVGAPNASMTLTNFTAS